MSLLCVPPSAASTESTFLRGVKYATHAMAHLLKQGVMGGCPPDPGLRSFLLLLAAAKLGWRGSGRVAGDREVGALVDARGVEHHLVVTAGERSGTCVWALLEGGERPAMAFAMTNETFEALRSGVAAEEGAVSVNGQLFWLRAEWNGVAELVRGDCSTETGA